MTARNITLTDCELSHEIKDMSYDRFVTNKSAYRIEERYLDEYRETLKKERERGPHILLCAVASAVIALIYYIANKKEE